jgi:hypothetical protein
MRQDVKKVTVKKIEINFFKLSFINIQTNLSKNILMEEQPTLKNYFLFTWIVLPLSQT